MKKLDLTSWIGVVICVILLFTYSWWNAKNAAKEAAEKAAREKEKAAQTPIEESPKTTPENGTTAPASEGAPAGDQQEIAEKTTTLSNDVVSLNLTNKGAGVATVDLLDSNLKIDSDAPLILNTHSTHGIGVLSTGPGEFDTTNWKVTNTTPSSVTYETTTEAGLHYTKTFRLPEGESDPHEFSMEISIRNESGNPYQLTDQFIYAGSGAPLHLNEWSVQIGMYWYEEGGKFDYETVDHFKGRKILGFGRGEIPFDIFDATQMKWAGVNNQFYTTILRPETPYDAELWGSRFPVVVNGDKEGSEKKKMFATEAGIGLPVETLNPGDQETLQFDIYVGPKEFARLKALGDERQEVMHYDQIPVFGWLFGWAIKPLASLLIWSLVHLKDIVGNYGIAIILITVLIRLLIWPVYAKSARSMKRMSKLNPMMKEIREKHEDDPQKMNQEMMKLYQTYGINPLGGCLPMFIQLPVFLAFYRMLWSAAELRHESFLWIDDLAMPDTLFEIPGLGIPFNLLPILMGVTSFIQMAITPKTGGRTQQMIFMLMPVIFLVICYNFAAALALYWTTSNLFSILQTWLMNKLPEPELKKKANAGKKGFLARMQEQAEAAQKTRSGGGATSAPGNPASRTKMPGEKGERHTKGKKRRK